MFSIIFHGDYIFCICCGVIISVSPDTNINWLGCVHNFYLSGIDPVYNRREEGNYYGYLDFSSVHASPCGSLQQGMQ